MIASKGALELEDAEVADLVKSVVDDERRSVALMSPVEELAAA